jgi:hypothetical protein
MNVGEFLILAAAVGIAVGFGVDMYKSHQFKQAKEALQAKIAILEEQMKNLKK